MPGFFHTFTSLRVSEPDPASLLSTLKGMDPSAGMMHELGNTAYILKKATSWTAQQVNAVQNVIDTAPVATPELAAQSVVDNWPIVMKALLLTLIDQINVLRAGLTPPLNPVTTAQAIAAVRARVINVSN